MTIHTFIDYFGKLILRKVKEIGLIATTRFEGLHLNRNRPNIRLRLRSIRPIFEHSASAKFGRIWPNIKLIIKMEKLINLSKFR